MGQQNSAFANKKRIGPFFLIILSWTALSFLVSFRLQSTSESMVWGTLVSMVVCLLLAFITPLFEQLTWPSTLKMWALSSLFALVTCGRILVNFTQVLDQWVLKNEIQLAWDRVVIDGILILLSLVALYSVFLVYTWFFTLVEKTVPTFIKSLNRIEWTVLIGGTLIMLMMIVCFFSLSSAFTSPIYQGKVLPFDVVYISDTPNHLITDVFFNIGARENDLRQPLFAVTAMPLANLAWMGSILLFFIPHAYAILLQGFQIILLLITMILLSRLLKVKGMDQALFLGFILSGFPVLLFTVMIEQYILALFWLILFITAVLNDHREKALLFILATGNMLTTGFLFPWLTKARSIKSRLITLWMDFLGLMAALMVFAQFHLIYFIAAPYQKMESIAPLFRTFEDKLLQYLTFVASCFIAPSSEANLTFMKYPSYQQTVITTVNPLGIVLILLALVGFILNHKDRFARIALFWVCLSYLVLGLVGWGTLENGLILYVLYFGWAYSSLIFMGFKTLLKPWPKIRLGLGVGIILLILVINSAALGDLLRFCMEVYPAR